jgi:protein-L-isoaspartate(D-aspartate) O-methyltransferase
MEPTEARTSMVERLTAAGTLTSPAVSRAMLTIPRHRFVPSASIEEAYADTAVATKHAVDGTALSSISQPTIVATMLELADPKPGHKILEIGTGTGYNAALLGTIVGPGGVVVTIELEADLAEAAADRIDNAGVTNCHVVTGDGAAGHRPMAPYDRIVVTAGASTIASTWIGQLADDGGRLVVPIVDDSGVGHLQCLVKVGDKLQRTTETPCGFLRLRTLA